MRAHALVLLAHIADVCVCTADAPGHLPHCWSRTVRDVTHRAGVAAHRAAARPMLMRAHQNDVVAEYMGDIVSDMVRCARVRVRIRGSGSSHQRAAGRGCARAALP